MTAPGFVVNTPVGAVRVPIGVEGRGSEAVQLYVETVSRIVASVLGAEATQRAWEVEHWQGEARLAQEEAAKLRLYYNATQDEVRELRARLDEDEDQRPTHSPTLPQRERLAPLWSFLERLIAEHPGVVTSTPDILAAYGMRGHTFLKRAHATGLHGRGVTVRTVRYYFTRDVVDALGLPPNVAEATR